MIKLAYDITSVAESPYGGIAQVCYHTLAQAAKHGDISATGFYRRGRRENIAVDNVPLRRLIWTDRFRRSQFDIVHALCHRLPPVGGQKRVYTLYDAWSLYPNKYQSPSFQKTIGMRMKRELRKVDAIIAISDNTHKNLVELQLVDPNKCRVARIGVAPPEPPTPAGGNTEIENCLSRPYVLFVGRIEVRKNIGHIIDAVAPISQLDLVIVGEPGYGYDDITRSDLARFPQDRLHVLSRLDTSDLELLYRRALATLLPSWEEGFGLPILEAMVRGCPVITSNCSACAEVGAGGAILVDPANPSESTEALIRLYEDASYHDRIKQAGLHRSRDFSWEKYFDDLISVYRSVLSQ